MECVFCKIVKKELPSDILYEDERFLVFKDINPKAPIHVLIIPKKHIPSLAEVEEADKEIIGEMFLLAKKIAKEQGIADRGYRLIFNVGKEAGQTIPHLHLHLMGGKKLPFE